MTDPEDDPAPEPAGSPDHVDGRDPVRPSAGPGTGSGADSSAEPAAAAAAVLERDPAASALRDGLAACAEHVAPAGSTGEHACALRDCLRASGVLEPCPGLVARLAEAAGLALSAPPVAAPPYVAVTGVGLVLRAAGREGRLVVTLRAFDVVRAGERRGAEASGTDSNGPGDATGAVYRRREAVAVETAFEPRR